MTLPESWGFYPDSRSADAVRDPDAVTARERRELRERSVSHAAYVHCDVGDAMVVFNRDAAIGEVLKTAEEFYQWIIRNTEDEQ